MKKKVNDLINKISTAESLNRINELILNMYPGMEARFFPIYVRYLKNGELFGLLYFNKKDHFVLGIASQKKFLDNSRDANWMKYKEIKYCINIAIDSDFTETIRQIKKILG